MCRKTGNKMAIDLIAASLSMGQAPEMMEYTGTTGLPAALAMFCTEGFAVWLA
jgi:hypothetical protein